MRHNDRVAPGQDTKDAFNSICEILALRQFARYQVSDDFAVRL
jgi:hypothetical protein